VARATVVFILRGIPVALRDGPLRLGCIPHKFSAKCDRKTVITDRKLFYPNSLLVENFFGRKFFWLKILLAENSFGRKLEDSLVVK